MSKTFRLRAGSDTRSALCNYLGASCTLDQREKPGLTFVHKGSQTKPSLAAVCLPARAARAQRRHKSRGLARLSPQHPEGWRDSLLSWSQRGAPGLSVPALSGGASPGIHSRPADGVIAPAPLLFSTQAGGPTYSLYLLLYNNFGNSHGS